MTGTGGGAQQPSRPGAWVPGLGAWAARAGDLADKDVAVVDSLAGRAYSGRELRELGVTDSAAWVMRWADGSVPAPPRNLTRRESEVLALIGQGLSIDQTAAEMTLSRETVRTHLQSLYRKLGVRDRAEAVAVAWREGLVDRTRT